jgi:phosphoribosyl-dephospho-CoA transferase
MDARAHDLLWLDRPDAFQPAGELPGPELPLWLDGAWLARAPLVVRREALPAGRIAVGARGLQRNQRCAGVAEAGAVTRRVSPAMLARSLAGRSVRLGAAAVEWPCVAALLLLAPRLDALGVEWGPAGGAGFWLASGLPVLRATSDLDLVVRAPTRLDEATIAALCALQEKSACRLDIQVDTGLGGFALSEHASGAARVLLKTAHGPRLVADPWIQPEAA